MKKPLTFLLFWVVGVLAGGNQLTAQCCAAGNPLSIAPDMQLSSKNELKFSLLYRISVSDTYFDVNRPIAIQYVDQSGFHYTEFGIEYGLFNRLSIRLDAGYFLSKYEHYFDPGFQSKIASGLADLNASARFAVLEKPSKRLQLNATAGMKFPVGVFDLTVNNVKLPVQLQPSSGSYRFHGGLVLVKGLKNRNFSGLVGTNMEYSKRIQSKYFDYHYGTVYSFFAGGAYNIQPGITAIFQMQAEYREKSKRENNQPVEASGGTLLSAAPQLNYAFGKGWNVHMAFSVPVYRHYNSIQLGSKYAFSIHMSKAQKLRNEKLFQPGFLY